MLMYIAVTSQSCVKCYGVMWENHYMYIIIYIIFILVVQYVTNTHNMLALHSNILVQ